MRASQFLIAGFVLSLAACGTDAEAPTKDGVAELPGLELAADAKADGSPYARYQGAIELDDRHAAFLPVRTGYHMWTFEPEEGSEVYIDLASREGDDMYLLLYRETDAGWEYVDGNDDCYSGTLNSCLTLDAEAGRYLALASTYGYLGHGRREAADYEIEVFCNGGTCAAPEPQLCGSRGLDPCPDGQYCDWTDDACGAADVPGTCQVLPDICPLYYAPVCGCDGQTYSNVCFAARDGVDFSSAGECDPPGQAEGELCGGIAGFMCEAGLRCDYSANLSCNISDVAGVCVVDEPVLCTQQYVPVCGCDGQTYSNDCHRTAAGVAFDHDGEC